MRERLSESARVRGDELLAKLRAIDHPAIIEVRGKGLLIGVEIDPAFASARQVCEGLLARGVLSKDTHGTVVRFAPPLVVESEHIDLAVAALAETLAGARAAEPARGLSRSTPARSRAGARASAQRELRDDAGEDGEAEPVVEAKGAKAAFARAARGSA